MRTEVRLTGRRKIPIKAVSIEFLEGAPQKVVFIIRQKHNFNKMPGDSVVKLRLLENKNVQTIRLGHLSELRRLSELGAETTKSLRQRVSRPSCQIRVVNMRSIQQGLLLGCTGRWTIDADGSKEDAVSNDGILKFATRSIGPRTWALEFPDLDHPTVYLDDSLPNPKSWVRKDPVFVGFVLPAIIREILDYILQEPEDQETKWKVDWMAWSQALVPDVPPPFEGDYAERSKWIEQIIEKFALKHQMLQKFLRGIG